MRIRTYLASILILIVSLATAQQRPNIVVIISDDHAYQAISAYGGKLMKTPNIDRIAKEGVLFNKAYVTNSICGPSRAVILTGKYSHKNGFKDNEHSTFDGSQDSFIKPWMIDRANDHYALDITRAKTLLGWQPKRSLRDTIPLMIAALKADPGAFFKENDLELPSELKEAEQVKT